MNITFCGAADCVTGSCHLITTDKYKFLLDCGQFQGNKTMEARNYEDFPFDPAELDFMILSHAHVDHCGRIPLLVKRGFKGKIYCTDATADLVDIMLKDSGYIHEKDAEQQNRKNERAGRPLVEPLYTYNDALDALKFLSPVLYDQLVEVNDDIKIVFNDAGHILGSAITEIFVEEEGNVSKIVFSGDLGVVERPILRDPTIIKKADYLIMETTYGNRLHAQHEKSVLELVDIIIKTTERGGNVVIPSFAVGRTQELIYELNKYFDSKSEIGKKLRKVKVYVDSPMSYNATEAFKDNAQVFDEEAKDILLKDDNPLDFKNLHFSVTSEESQAINFDREPKIIISASGMCEAGRIRHHLKHNLWDGKNSIVFVGYQAEGTLGRLLIDGMKEVTLFGEQIMVNAEIYSLEGFSGHADRDGLVNWLKGFQKAPKQIFLVHGEMDSKRDFADYVKANLGLDTIVVEGVSEYEFDKADPVSVKEVMKEEMGEEEIADIKRRIALIEENIDSVLRSANLAIDSEVSAERLAEINNIVLELEKQTLNLNSTVTKEDRAKEEKSEEKAE